jgi:hypothetical protein
MPSAFYYPIENSEHPLQFLRPAYAESVSETLRCVGILSDDCVDGNACDSPNHLLAEQALTLPAQLDEP